jgi:hypothetical protein
VKGVRYSLWAKSCSELRHLFLEAVAGKRRIEEIFPSDSLARTAASGELLLVKIPLDRDRNSIETALKSWRLERGAGIH